MRSARRNRSDIQEDRQLTALGLILCFAALVLFLVSLVWIYSTTMTVRRSRVSWWALGMMILSLVLCTVGVFVLLA